MPMGVGAIFDSSAENSLKSAKKVQFSIFYLSMGGGCNPPWLRSVLQSTNQFLDHQTNFQVDLAHKLVSFNLLSFFTDVPFEETIQIITGTIYSHQSSEN